MTPIQSKLITSLNIGTAICFILAAITLGLLSLETNTRLLTGFTALIFITSLFEFLLHINTIPSSLFNILPIHQPFMALNTSIEFLFLCFALFFSLPKKLNYKILSVSLFFSSFLLISAILFLAGYFMGIEYIYGFGSFKPIAPFAAAGFILLGLGLNLHLWQKSMVIDISNIKIPPIVLFIATVLATGIYALLLTAFKEQFFASTALSLLTIFFGFIIAFFMSLCLRLALVARTEANDAKEQSAKTQKALSLIEATLEATADGVLVVDTQQKVTYFNQKFLHMWKIPKKLAAKKEDGKLVNHVLNQLKKPDEFITGIKNVYQNPKVETFVELHFKDGRVFERYSKPQWLNAMVIGHVFSFRDVTNLRKIQAELNYQSTHDVLTNLPNRALLTDRLIQAIRQVKEEELYIAILFVDIDNIKSVNNSISHTAGDLIIKETAERLKKSTENQNTLARFGYDKFVVLLTQLQSQEDCLSTIHLYMGLFEKPYEVNKQSINLAVSLGISLFPKDGDDAETLIKNADTALAIIKDKGGNDFEFYSSNMNAKMLQYMTLEQDLRLAIENNELFLYFQPIIHLKTQRITGAEALLRWQHKRLGFIPPPEFIPIAEKIGLIHKLGDFVLKQATIQLKQWQTFYHDPLRIAVNFSTKQFHLKNLSNTIKNTLKEIQLNPQSLEIELTESLLMEDSELSIENLNALGDMKIRLSIDDFGTGYSSLSYLKRFQLNNLKIDKSFVRDIGIDIQDTAIVKAIIQMAKSLQLNVIAKGVENAAQMEFLLKQGCYEAQGYYFSPPIDANRFTALLKKHMPKPNNHQ